MLGILYDGKFDRIFVQPHMKKYFGPTTISILRTYLEAGATISTSEITDLSPKFAPGVGWYKEIPIYVSFGLEFSIVKRTSVKE